MVLSTIVGESAPDLETTPQPNYFYLPGLFVIQKYFESSLIPLLNNIQIQWYHNGTAVDDSRTNSSWKTQGERLTLSLTVFNASEEIGMGLYEGVLNVGVINIYLSTGHSLRYYRYVVGDLNIEGFIRVASFQVLILEYGKLKLLYCA